MKRGKTVAKPLTWSEYLKEASDVTLTVFAFYLIVPDDKKMNEAFAHLYAKK